MTDKAEFRELRAHSCDPFRRGNLIILSSSSHTLVRSPRMWPYKIQEDDPLFLDPVREQNLDSFHAGSAGRCRPSSGVSYASRTADAAGQE